MSVPAHPALARLQGGRMSAFDPERHSVMLRKRFSLFSVQLAECEAEWVAKLAGSSGSMIIVCAGKTTDARSRWMLAMRDLLGVAPNGSYHIELPSEVATYVRIQLQLALKQVHATTPRKDTDASGGCGACICVGSGGTMGGSVLAQRSWWRVWRVWRARACVIAPAEAFGLFTRQLSYTLTDCCAVNTCSQVGIITIGHINVQDRSSLMATLETSGPLDLVHSDPAFTLAVVHLLVEPYIMNDVTGCKLDEGAANALRELIRKALASYDGTVIKQPGDGSCFYWSFGHQLKLSAADVRNGAATYMADHPESYSGDDLKRVRGSEWADEKAIEACCAHFKIGVDVYQCASNGSYHLIDVFNPLVKRRISVLFSPTKGAEHYDALTQVRELDPSAGFTLSCKPQRTGSVVSEPSEASDVAALDATENGTSSMPEKTTTMAAKVT
jgi:hypothetical protein